MCPRLNFRASTTARTAAFVAIFLAYCVALVKGDCSAVLCPALYEPVCSGNTTYPNSCIAECEVGRGGWSKGRCLADEANPVAGCIGNVRCSRDACQEPWPTQCQNPLPKNAVCFNNPCAGVTFNGEQLEPCTALWVDPSTKQLIKCGGPVSAPVCKCPKIYEPVCSWSSDGTATEYANACLAVCALGGGGKWTTGACAESCVCTKIYDPVCGVDGKTYSNPCQAGCAKVAVASAGECSTGGGAAPREATAGGQTSCLCSKEYEPVCGSGGIDYGNKCLAECALGKGGKYSKGTCASLNPFNGCLGNVRCLRNTCDTPCREAAPGSLCFQNTCTGQKLYGKPVDPCAAVWVDPATKKAVVCGVQENPVVDFSCPSGKNMACLADPCAMVSPECAAAMANATCEAAYCTDGVLSDGTSVPPCTALWRQADGSVSLCPTTTAESPKDSDNDCICTKQYDPVCGSDGKTYGNDCTAACALGVNGTWKAGECRKACPCSKELVPVCGSDGNTYNNKCLAKCALGEDGNYTAGACPELCVCITQYDPVCGVNGKTYGNACQAACEEVEVASRGECGTSVISCPPEQTVKCRVDPCRFNECPAHPEATCLSSYCDNTTYRGVTVGPCGALFVDEAGDPVNCTKDDPMAVDNIGDCPFGAAVPLCIGRGNPCKGAVCGGHPDAACIVKSCFATYRGQALRPCQPTFYDEDTGDVLKCAKPDCTACPLSYDPVCGADGHTYPNRCAAECLGVEVRRTGKCQHCNGEECTIGKKNDLCILGSTKQCWSGKYECRLPIDGKAGAFLGKCLPKLNGGRHHRHMLTDV